MCMFLLATDSSVQIISDFFYTKQRLHAGEFELKMCFMAFLYKKKCPTSPSNT